MAICADAEVRREHEFKVLKFYYDEVVKNLEEKGKKVEFTMEQLTKAYKANFIIQAMLNMVLDPFLYPNVSPEQPNYAVKKAELEKLLLNARFAAEDAIEYLKYIPGNINLTEADLRNIVQRNKLTVLKLR
ncbi:hypothetical protein L596_023369 [Steinernema carpocapsae]|nr:hypothetical protein L596_023369 [Steinernema carpocapsae]